jgi:lincosamide nucleotidyltransferase
MLRRLQAAAEQDPRIVGLVDYGSGSFGRADEWSDVDAGLFIRDADMDAFTRDWKTWAAGFGYLLLAYVGQIGHPWTVYDTSPIPLRVDFDLLRESELDSLARWPLSPVSAEVLVLYDGTGRLTALAQQLIGNSLAPADPHAEFERLCGDFWYFLLYCHSKLSRGERWAARTVFETEPLSFLCYLLRLEAGATQRWRASSAAFDIERTLSAERLARLEECVPARGPESLLRAMITGAQLGREVCFNIASTHGWTWPEALAERVIEILNATGKTSPPAPLHRYGEGSL